MKVKCPLCERCTSPGRILQHIRSHYWWTIGEARRVEGGDSFVHEPLLERFGRMSWRKVNATFLALMAKGHVIWTEGVPNLRIVECGRR